MTLSRVHTAAKPQQSSYETTFTLASSWFHNVKESENYFLDLPKIKLFFSWPMSHPSNKSCRNPFSRFCMILLTNLTTNKPTKNQQTNPQRNRQTSQATDWQGWKPNIFGIGHNHTVVQCLPPLSIYIYNETSFSFLCAKHFPALNNLPLQMRVIIPTSYDFNTSSKPNMTLCSFLYILLCDENWEQRILRSAHLDNYCVKWVWLRDCLDQKDTCDPIFNFPGCCVGQRWRRSVHQRIYSDSTRPPPRRASPWRQPEARGSGKCLIKKNNITVTSVNFFYFKHVPLFRLKKNKSMCQMKLYQPIHLRNTPH